MRRQVVGTLLAIFVVCAVGPISGGAVGVGTVDGGTGDIGTVDSGTASIPDTQYHIDDSELGVDDLVLERSASTTTSLDQLRLVSSDRQIGLTTTLDRTSERTSEITATSSVAIPDRVTELTLRIPEEATVVETEGFSQASGNEYEWDTRTDDPSVTFRVSADRRVDSDGPLAEEGDLLFTATDEWALVQIPSLGANWRFTGGGEMTVDRRTEIDGPGVAGERMAFLGEYDEHSHTAHDQRFRLIVPHAADLDESPETIFDSLSHASDTLRVGDRDAEVFMIAAPTEGIEWGVSGLQGGSADMWVGDDERVDTPANVWVHEYVHARQDYETTDETRWFTEASATYYAALLTLQEGRIGFGEFQRYLADGEAEPQSKAVLSDPQSWENNADYRKGALVAGEIDRQIRVATDSESSFNAVFRSLNSHDGALTAADFEQYVNSASTADVAEHATRYTTTADTPTMWDGDQHAAAFGQEPARFTFELAADTPLTVSGPGETVNASRNNLTITAGQTVTVALTVTNIGQTVGNYELPFAVGNDSQAETGRLGPGEQVTHEFSHTFETAGTYTITAGDERIELVVQPADSGVGDAVDVEVPGFGLTAAVVALLGSIVLGRRMTRS